MIFPKELDALGYSITEEGDLSTRDIEEKPHEIRFYEVDWELVDKNENESIRNSSLSQNKYVFAPVLTGSCILAEGVELPEITAVVQPKVNVMSLMSMLGVETFVVPTTASDLTNHLLSENSDITILGSPSFTGVLTASSKYDSLNLGTMNIGGKDTSFSLPPGILVTSGDGTPPETNSQNNYTAQSNGPTDSDVETYAGVNNSRDSFSLQFEFTVPENIPAVSFMFMFGSEEYPEYLDSEYVDGAAVIVDGVNYAKFKGDVPLKVVSAAELNANSGLAIEYNGVSAPKAINALLDKTRTTHTIKIVIADTSDTSYDSGLFISAMKTSTSEVGGIIERNDASLVTVAGINDDTPGLQSGINPQNAIKWDIEVPSSKSTIQIDDISTAKESSFELYSDSQFTSKITGNNSISLISGAVVPVYIKVTALDGVTVKYYAINVSRFHLMDIDLADITVTPYSGEYDGENHSITVVDANGGTVTYSTSETGEYTTENPTYKNVGNYTVYYKVNRGTNYNVLSGSSIVEIKLREVTIKGVVIKDKIFDGTIDATTNVIGGYLEGVLEVDDIVLDSSNMSAEFIDEKIENNKLVTISGYALKGLNVSQYYLKQPKDIIGNILAEKSSDMTILIEQVLEGDVNYDGKWTNNDITIILKGTAPSGIEKYQYTIDNGLSWIDIEKSTLLIEETTNGSYLFRAISNGGITSNCSNTIDVKIDKTKPVIRNIQGNNTTPKNQAQTITFEVFEENSGIGLNTLTVSKDKVFIEVKNENGKYSFIAEENGKYEINVSDNTGNTASMTTVEVNNLDFQKPFISSLTPNNNEQKVDTVLLTATFNEDVMKSLDGISGNITIIDSNGYVFEKIDINNNRIKVSGNKMDIYITKSFKPGTEYYVIMDNGIICDIANNGFIGINDNNTWKFKTNNVKTKNSIIGIDILVKGEKYKAIVDPYDDSVYSVVAEPNNDGTVTVKITPVLIYDTELVIKTPNNSVEINKDTVTITDISKETANVTIQIKNSDGSMYDNRIYTLIILRGSLETKITKTGITAEVEAGNLRGAVDVSSDISNGKQMELELTIAENENLLDESQKLEIEKFLKGQSIVMYLDIELKLKDITNSTETLVDNTQNPIRIKIEIPSNMLGGRDYKIIRLHNGIIEILDTIREGNYLIFETDRFSQYAISYTLYSDNEESDKKENIEYHKSYIKGYEDETFRPENKITRAEAATIIARLSSAYDEHKYYVNLYGDVDAQAWYGIL